MFKRWRNIGELLPECVERFLLEFPPKHRILLEMEKFASQNKVPILLPASAGFLRFLTFSLKPQKVLDIGCGIGYSTANILLGWKGSCVLAVDLNPDRLRQAREFLKGFEGRVTLLHTDALSLLSELLHRQETFDLVLVDCTKAEYPFFNAKVQALLSPGGVAVFDNALFRGYVACENYPKKYRRTVELLKLFLRQVKEYPNHFVLLLPVGDGLLLTWRKCV